MRLDFNSVSTNDIRKRIGEIVSAATLLQKKMDNFEKYEEELRVAANKCDNDIVQELKQEIRAIERKYHNLRLGGLTPEEIDFINKNQGEFKIEIVQSPVETFKTIKFASGGELEII